MPRPELAAWWHRPKWAKVKHAYEQRGSSPDASGYAPGRLATALCGVETTIAQFTGKLSEAPRCWRCKNAAPVDQLDAAESLLPEAGGGSTEITPGDRDYISGLRPPPKGGRSTHG